MPLSHLGEAGISATLSAVLVLTGITFVSAKIALFPLPVVVAGLSAIIVGFAFGIRAAYFTFLYYQNGGF